MMNCNGASIPPFKLLLSHLNIILICSRRFQVQIAINFTIRKINLRYVPYNKVREFIAVKVLHTILLNTTVVAFKVLPLGSYAPMPAPSPPFKTILELVLWNGFQSCRCITSDVINVILSSGTEKKSLGARSGEQTGCFNTVICLVAKNSLTESAVWAGALLWWKIHELLAQSSGRFRLTFSRSLFSTSK